MTAYRGPLLLLVLAALLSTWASPLLVERTLPALALLAAAVVLGGIVASLPTRRAETHCLALVSVIACGHLWARPNELGGVVTLALPLAALRLLRPRTRFGRRGQRFANRLLELVLTLALAALLARSGSRGAILACAAGLAVGLARLGRRGRRLLLAGVLVALAAAALAGPERLASFWIYGDSSQGLSAATLTTGRPAIWQRALHAIADAPLTGTGLGTFGPVAAGLYGASPGLEDAHQLALQAATELGLPGLAALLGSLLVAVRRAAASPALLAALVAHLVFNLGDCVAPGSPGHLALWALLGAIATVPHTAGPARRPFLPPPSRLRRLGAAAAVVLFLLFVLPPGRDLLRLNLAARDAAAAVVGGADPQKARAELARLGATTCRAGWLAARVAESAGDLDGRDAAWRALLRCSSRLPPFLLEAAADRRELAALAVELHPESAAARFWLARLAEEESAIVLYRQGLALEPGNGLAWIRLGDLLARHDRRAALGAYLEGCRHGDPGANGCWRAGQAAEALDQPEVAIAAYRRSHWETARRRAETLTKTSAKTMEADRPDR